MSSDQFYDYVRLAGPEIHKGIQANLSELAQLDHEEQKEAIEKIAREAKARARQIIIERDNIQRLPKR